MNLSNHLLPCALSVLLLLPGCLKHAETGNGSPVGSGGSSSSGGASGSGGTLNATCAAVFNDHCERDGYDFYRALCQNENSAVVASVLNCVVPYCWTPADANTAGYCLMAAINANASSDVAVLAYALESRCGCQLYNPEVQTVLAHAVGIASANRLDALSACAIPAECTKLTECLLDVEVVPWWKPQN